MLAGKIFRVGSVSVRQLNTSALNGIRQAKFKFPIVQSLRRGAQTKVRSWDHVVKKRPYAAEKTARAILGGTCVAGVGALCFYGLGLSNEAGAIDKAMFWPQEVRTRIKSTYLYFTGSLGFTAGAAYYLSRSQLVYRMMGANPWLVFGGGLAAMIGSSIACRSILYEPGLNAKHMAWAVHSGIVGCVIAPLMLLGGPMVLRAATYTAGTVASLSLTAACAPDEKFLTWGGPLALCLGGVCVASVGSMLLPATSAAVPVLHTVVTYGGLVVFGGFMLYDTQKIIQRAQLSVYNGQRYDPINASMGIYMDTVNIFIRILMILSGRNNRR